MFDLSPEAKPRQASAAGMQSLGFAPMESNRSPDHFASPEQIPCSTDEFSASLDLKGLINLNSQYNCAIDAVAHNTNAMSSYTGDEAPHTSYANVMGVDPMWLTNTSLASVPDTSTTAMSGQGMFAWSPDASMDSFAQSHGFDFMQNSTCHHPQTMYQNTLDGSLIGNPSTQTFMTTSSEEGEHPDLITPPQETSPMLGLNQGIFQRRHSNSSEIADNIDTTDIHRPRVGRLGLHEASNAPSVSKPVTTAGLATPEISPQSAAAKTPFGPDLDLASRRKRPRPAALQPDTKRSQSYAGPLTTSPHVRRLSPTLKVPSPVRRIKSTGNNMNVMTGRVQKPNSVSTQMSPHNLQSCFDASSVPESGPRKDSNSTLQRSSDVDVNLLTPSSPAAFTQQTQDSWQGYPSTTGTVAPTWSRSNNSVMPIAIAAAPGFSFPPSPPVLAPTVSPPFIQQPPAHQSVYHCPPQSAPPHLTSFFEGPPPMAGEAFGHSGWPTPSVTPPEAHRNGGYMPLPLRPNHVLHHSHSGPLNHYTAAAPPFQSGPSRMGGFQPFHTPIHSTPTPPQKDLDIKVDVGPAPLLSHESKNYTFHHTNPEDFAAASNARK